MRGKKRTTQAKGEKTVFILGAGFTLPARGPTQAEMLPLITRRRLNPALRQFFSKVFCAETLKSISQINLEDVFTVLDRAVLFQENVRGLSYHQADELRRLLIRELVRILGERLDYPSKPHAHFAKNLLDRRIAAGLEGDPFSVINFNWDILLDKTLHEACCAGELEGQPEAQIDYCCFTYALEPAAWKNREHIAGTLLKSSGIFNLKILKLHGSVNWLLCPQCAKLFTSFDERLGLRNRSVCPACREHPHLDPLIITPTLLKDLQTIQLKTIWHNALTELQEANRIVFVGYSFPMADFEFRYVLAKGVQKAARIVVINRPRSSARALNGKERVRFEVQKKTLEQRYRSFFGARRVDFPDIDAEGFMVSDLWSL
jgi:hypothetical protein